MKKISKKIISSILIIMLLMPTFLVFAEEINIEHEYKLEEYLKASLNLEQLTDEKLEQVEYLSVSDEAYSYIDGDYNRVNFNLSILPKLTNIKEINISFSGLKTFDFKLIDNLNKLEKITLNTDSLKEVKNISEISKLENLKEIYIKSTNAKFTKIDLSGIEKIKNLESFKIESGSLSKITGKGSETNNSNKTSLIIECINLKELEIDSIHSLNKIVMNANSYYDELVLKNLKLNKLSNLERLTIKAKSLDKEEISNSINGNNLPKLKELNFRLGTLENKIENLDLFELFNISSFKELTILDLDTNENEDVISKVNIKDEMSNLQTLRISSEIKEITNIQKLKNLKNLYLVGIKLNSIQIPENVVSLNIHYATKLIDLKLNEKLEKINLNDCWELKELKLNNSLEIVELYFCSDIEEIAISEEMKNLNKLVLDWCHNIKKLDLPKELNLKTLQINCDENVVITNYPTALENLAITRKKVVDIPGNLINLKELEIGNYSEYIQQINLPEKTDLLQNLEHIKISSNNTNEINYPDNLIKLEIYGIGANEITLKENLNKLEELTISMTNELEKLNLPEDKTKLEKINEIRIYDSKIKNINCPNSLEILVVHTNSNEFNICADDENNLKNISFDSENIKELTIPENLKKLSWISITTPNLEKLNLPEDTKKLEELSSIYIYNCKTINELNYPDNLFFLEINTKETEKINIKDNLVGLYRLKLSGDNLKEINLPEDTSKLSNLKEITLNCKTINEMNYPDGLEEVSITSSELKELKIPENLQKLKTLSITTPNLEKLNLPEDTGKLMNIIGIYIDDCKSINELNYPDHLFSLRINTKETEKINIKDNLVRLYRLELSGDNLKEINLPEDTTKLENLEYMTLNCKKINNINYPNKLKELKITSSEETNIAIPNNTVELKKLNIKADNASINIENIEKYNMDKVNLICKNIQGNCIDELTNLKGLKLFTQENFETEKISKLKKLQYLSLNQNYKPGEGDNGDIDSNSVLKYDQKPIYIGKTDSEVEYLYGFKFKNEDVYDNKSEFIKKFDYSKLIDEYYITDPKLEILDKDGKAIEDSTIIGTGNIVKIYDGEDLVVEYSIVYYGDVDGDGKWTAIDSLAIIKNNFTQNGYTIEEPFTFSSDIFEEAGRIISGEDTIPGAMDALAIVKQSFGTYSIDQYKNKVEE